jgi:hypothetical protein
MATFGWTNQPQSAVLSRAAYNIDLPAGEFTPTTKAKANIIKRDPFSKAI